KRQISKSGNSPLGLVLGTGHLKNSGALIQYAALGLQAGAAGRDWSRLIFYPLTWENCNLQSASFQHVLMALFLSRLQLMLHYRSSTAIPSQGGVVVAGLTDRFRFFVPAHRFAEALIGKVAGAEESSVELSSGFSLMNDARVIRPFVLA